jgi:hypothetical protein
MAPEMPRKSTAKAREVPAPASIKWEKQMLSDNVNEGVAVLDVNNDGKLDVTAGPNWYEGPEFKPHRLREVKFLNKEFMDSNGEHGYDVKAAMHVIRLLNEGIELIRSGTITLPRPEKELLITIRTGQYGSLDRVLTLANDLFKELEQAQAESRLPETVDRERISKLLTEVYLNFWRDHGLRH